MNDWDPYEEKRALERVLSAGIELKPGDRVRLHPRGGADIFDLALAGKTATIAAIEQDMENRIHLAVTVDDDPGRDLGIEGKPGHRFFYSVEEVELLDSNRSHASIPNRRILIACIGNIFLGDDAFGVEVAARLARKILPEGVRAVNYGIRSFDLALALLGGYDDVIMVDAAPRGGTPGTLYVIEPTLPQSAGEGAAVAVSVETHGMGPEKVLSLAAALGGGGTLPHVLVVGCEPSPLAVDEADMIDGLSPPVRAAVDEAVALVESLGQRLLASHDLKRELPAFGGQPGSVTN